MSTHTHRPPPEPSSGRRLNCRVGESGSAFITVLLAVFVLTLLGLALAFVTETEMQLGANERVLERVLAAADTGIGVATAKALVVPDNRPLRLELVDPGPDPNITVQNEVEVSPLLPLLVTPCNLCMINQGTEFFKIDHAVNSRVTRVAWSGTGPRPANPMPIARKRLSVMIDFQPWQQSTQVYAEGIQADPGQFEF